MRPEPKLEELCKTILEAGPFGVTPPKPRPPSSRPAPAAAPVPAATPAATPAAAAPAAAQGQGELDSPVIGSLIDFMSKINTTDVQQEIATHKGDQRLTSSISSLRGQLEPLMQILQGYQQ